MTYGQWLDRARDEIQRACTHLPTTPAVNLGDISTALVARRNVYRGLARLVEIVADGPPARTDIDRDTVDYALRLRQNDPTGLYLGLTSAAQLDARYGTAATPISTPGRALASAADALNVAGDILTSHASPGRLPHTPEGAALRTGADQTAALADIADLAREMMRADSLLPTWIHNSHPDAHVVYAPTIADTRWTSKGPLAGLTWRLKTAAHGTVSYARRLETPPPTQPHTTIPDGSAAHATLLAARNWMYQNQAEVRITHIRAATRLGHLVSTLARGPAVKTGWQAWRTAAHTAAKLDGSPAFGAAADIVANLVLVERWAKQKAPRPPLPISVGARSIEIDHLATTLPTLAEVLQIGLLRAVAHGHIFVVRQELSPVAKGLIYHTVDRWTVADHDDAQVSHLRYALYNAGGPAVTTPFPEPRGASRLAKLAFATPAPQEADAHTDRTGSPPKRGQPRTSQGPRRRR